MARLTPPVDLQLLDATPILPAHIEETVRAIAKLNADHARQATRLQRFADTLTALVAKPAFIGVLTVTVGAWIGVNLFWLSRGRLVVDPPPFNWLQGALALAAVYMTGLILSTQRRADQLASHREQLTLELAIVAEQKSAKIIALLEEMRRDNPLISNRVDHVADAMSTPADPHAVLDAIRETQAERMGEDVTSEPSTDVGRVDGLFSEPQKIKANG